MVFCNTVGCTDRAILDDGLREDDEEDPVVPEPRDDDDPGPDDDDGTEPPDDDGPLPPDDDDEPLPPSDCIDHELTSSLPLTFSASIDDGPSRFQPSCVGAENAEATHAFTAPAAGTYLFDTAESNFDTVLYALGPECAVPELACNDDVDGTVFSQIAVGMGAGETITVVVDGFGEVGSYQLRVQQGAECPQFTLPPDPEVIEAGVLDDSFTNSVSPSCGGGGGGPDVVYSWTAPFSAFYLFSTQGSDFDTVLSLYAPGCSTELDCNDDNADFTSELGREVAEGEEILIAVDSFAQQAGFYQLTILPL